MKEKSFEPGRDNIVLIGMPGAGKSTLGIVLAKILCMDFVDADLLIQQSCDKSLQRLIDTLGPDAFLEIENQVLSEMSFEHSVIATGGSAIYSEPAMNHLSEIGRVVYLKISFDELKCRLADFSERGVVMRDGIGMSLRELYDERLPLYEKYADITRGCERSVHHRRRPQGRRRPEVAARFRIDGKPAESSATFRVAFKIP